MTAIPAGCAVKNDFFERVALKGRAAGDDESVRTDISTCTEVEAVMFSGSDKAKWTHEWGIVRQRAEQERAADACGPWQTCLRKSAGVAATRCFTDEGKEPEMSQ